MSDNRTIEQRFWAKVAREILAADGSVVPAPPHPELGSPCWIWLGAKNREFKFAGQRMRVARLAYLLCHIDDLTGDFDDYRLRNRCGNEMCVNPAHMDVIRGRWRRNNGTEIEEQQ